MLLKLYLGLIFLTTLSLHSRVQAIGVNWGTSASHPLPPSKVVELLKANKISKVKLFDADPTVLESLSGSGIDVTVGILNSMLKSLNASKKAAESWVHNNLTRYLSDGGGGMKIDKEEDRAICRAVVMVSEDGEIGANQKKDKYWERVHEHFQSLIENRESRNAHGIANRYGTIKKEVSKYVSILRVYYRNRPSGWTELDIVRHARDQYENEQNKPFVLEHCYEILQAMPKFNPEVNMMNNAQIGQEEGGSETPAQSSQPDTHVEEHASIERPSGIKAAKKAKRHGASSSMSFDTMCSQDTAFIDFYKDNSSKRLSHLVRHQETMESYVRLKEREITLREKEEEDRIMSIITQHMPYVQKKYWEDRQNEIIDS